jgi:hypothetical protein
MSAIKTHADYLLELIDKMCLCDSPAWWEYSHKSYCRYCENSTFLAKYYDKEFPDFRRRCRESKNKEQLVKEIMAAKDLEEYSNLTRSYRSTAALPICEEIARTKKLQELSNLSRGVRVIPPNDNRVEEHVPGCSLDHDSS